MLERAILKSLSQFKLNGYFEKNTLEDTSASAPIPLEQFQNWSGFEIEYGKTCPFYKLGALFEHLGTSDDIFQCEKTFL